jgi:CRISPR/Cas system-associated endonuclease/helicase Cas3
LVTYETANIPFIRKFLSKKFSTDAIQKREKVLSIFNLIKDLKEVYRMVKSKIYFPTLPSNVQCALNL